MSKNQIVHGKDIYMQDIVVMHERDINLKKNLGFRKILSSVKAIGLIEPLCVVKEEDKYVIVDGFLRYKACEILGIEIVPCIIYKTKETYTYNRRVNRLSPVQEAKMIRKSLKTIRQSTVADVFGLRTIQYKLNGLMLQHLHKNVINALDDEIITVGSAAELSYVTHSRQLQIMNEMKQNNDYSKSFVRALVINSNEKYRNNNKAIRKPWGEVNTRKQDLVDKLQSAEKSFDFYTTLYRQYTSDLIKLFNFVRKFIINDRIKSYLDDKHRDILMDFEKIVMASSNNNTTNEIK